MLISLIKLLVIISAPSLIKGDLVSPRGKQGTSSRAPLGDSSGSSSNSGIHRVTTAVNVGGVSSNANIANTTGNINTRGSIVDGSKAVSSVDSSSTSAIPNTGVPKSDASTIEIGKLDGSTSNAGDNTSLTNENDGIGASEIGKVGGAPKIRKLVGNSEKGRRGVFLVEKSRETDAITTNLKDKACRSGSCIRNCKGKQCKSGKYAGTIQLPSGGAIVFV